MRASRLALQALLSTTKLIRFIELRHGITLEPIRRKIGQDSGARVGHLLCMDGDSNLHKVSFDEVLTWIGEHLHQPLTLERIARRAGLSPYHFSRLFTARAGRSVLAHVRHLRLVVAARRLANDPDVKLVDLAFDSGFESQEAFTRAFRRTFGASPGRLRRAYLIPIPHISSGPGASMSILPKPGDARVEQLPGLVERDGFSVAGFSHRFDQATKLAIPGLWKRLVEIMPFAGQCSWKTYGVVSSVKRGDGSFLYMAAGEIDPSADTPKDMERRDLPANAYAVFRIVMAGGPVHPQVKAALRIIWEDLVPASGLTVLEAPDFELYAGDMPPDQAGAMIDYHVPVRVRATQ